MAEADNKVDIKSIDPEKGFFDEFERPTKEQWKQEAVAALKGVPFEKVLLTKTYEDLTVEPLYWAEDIEGLPHLGSQPGFQPFVRGTRPEGSLTKPWQICQELTNPLPEEFNNEAKFDLSKGQTGLTMVLDRPTRRGLGPKDAAAEEVGRGGLSLETLADLQEALQGIDLTKVSLLCSAGASSLPLLAMVTGIVRERQGDLREVSGCIGSDPLAELALEGTLTTSLSAAYGSMAQVTLWAKKNAPKLQTVFVLGHPYHNGGAGSTQEVAFVLATGAEYIRELINRGMNIDEITPRFRFGLSIGSNFFMEIAKMRAIKILWSQIVAAFGGNEDSQKICIHARSSAFNKTVYDPYVNLLRITSEGFSAAVGGVDSMHLSPFDEPLKTPDRFSRRIARNTQIILQEEARFTVPIDMAGGSYYIEKLTDQFARAAWGIFQKIEEAGGMAAALKAGLPQTLIAETAAKRAKNIESRKDILLGTNMYANLLEKRIEVPVVNREELKKTRTAAIKAYREKHGEPAMKEFTESFQAGSPDSLDKASRALQAGATLSDLAKAIAERESERPQVKPLVLFRAAEAYENLRKRSEAYAEKNGEPLKIFLANMGPIPQHKPRADFTLGFFEVAGFKVLSNTGFATSEEAAEAALASGAPIVVVCSTDATYPDYVPALAEAVKRAKPETTVIVAGKQSEEVEKAFLQAGVDEFIHVRSNCYETNRKLQEKYMGVK